MKALETFAFEGSFNHQLKKLPQQKLKRLCEYRHKQTNCTTITQGHFFLF
jgi:hypothetical protein